MSSLSAAASLMCDMLGIDPRISPPNASTMRRYIRNLQKLLHPDRAIGSTDASRAQSELKFDFKKLRSAEEYLSGPRSDYTEYDMRIMRVYYYANMGGWVSRWNPHKLDGGAMFEPLPSFTAWMKSKQAENRGQSANGNNNNSSSSGGPPPASAPPPQPTAGTAPPRQYTPNDVHRIDVSSFRPSSWLGVPPFCGQDGVNPTQALLRFIPGSPIVGGPNIGVVVAAVEVRWGSSTFQSGGMTADAIVELPPFGYTPSPGSLTVQILLVDRSNGQAKALKLLRTVLPIRLRDLTNVWSECPGPFRADDHCPWTRNLMSMRVVCWYGVFGSGLFSNSEINLEIRMAYVNEFLQQVREALD